MIVVATTRRNGHPIPWYLESYGADLRGTLAAVHYEDLLEDPDPVTATYCFADLELLTDDQLVRAAQVRDVLTTRGCRVLNDPARTLRRFDLARALRREGVNTFDVYRESDPLDSCRFPVFVRGERDHDGRRSDLLDTPDEVRDTIRGLRTSEPELDDLLVVEFCDTADVEGIYRKYSAFIVGDTIVARHLMFSRDWQVKFPDLDDQVLLQEEREYVTTNPHEHELRPIFERAGVEYGRIDYAFRDGRIQVWEINTNPTILLSNRVIPPPRERGSMVVEAMRAVARPVVAPIVSRTPAGRRRRERQRHERTERRPRAEINHAFADRLATAWAAIDHPVAV